jgi:uncharacterized membrane protein YdfJ with MMPL/SSD domain
MKDKKLGIAVLVIVVLAVALLYLTVVGPKIQGYLVSKEAAAQENVVNAILSIVEQQGYVAIGDGENSVVLVKYNPTPDQQGAQPTADNEVQELN